MDQRLCPLLEDERTRYARSEFFRQGATFSCNRSHPSRRRCPILLTVAAGIDVGCLRECGPDLLQVRLPARDPLAAMIDVRL